MISCQKEKFTLDPNFTYLNGAYMSPNLKVVEQAGIEGIMRKTHPYLLSKSDFFDPVTSVKQAFAKLINTPESNRIAIVPSVSYGLANVAKNVRPNNKYNIILPSELFPSNYYAWEQLAKEKNLNIKIIPRPQQNAYVGRDWNENILNAIDEDTVLIALGHVHWTDGTLFELEKIRVKTKDVGALLIIDGTQSVGAFPFDVERIQPDALICAGYKWLMGPYGIGVAYYGPYFDEGQPIEENWINRLHSDDFQNLVNYQKAYQPLAGRYSVGEQSNFILIPMLQKALDQLLEWTPEAIQEYCQYISQDAISHFREMGCYVEDADYRAHHFFGVRLNNAFDAEELKVMLAKEKILVSWRGDAIRITPNVYNEKQDFDKLIQCFSQVQNKVV